MCGQAPPRRLMPLCHSLVQAVLRWVAAGHSAAACCHAHLNVCYHPGTLVALSRKNEQADFACRIIRRPDNMACFNLTCPCPPCNVCVFLAGHGYGGDDSHDSQECLLGFQRLHRP
jgi:hypothetical protein